MRNPNYNLQLKLAIIEKYDHLYRFAQDLSIHPTTVSNVIKGGYPIKRREKVRWSKKLGRPVDELFPESEAVR